jgi:hypothetical protein
MSEKTTLKPEERSDEQKAEAQREIKDQLSAQPAQVTPELKKKAELHPEDVPSPGDLGPGEGPSS